jgi:hypothetical protein
MFASGITVEDSNIGTDLKDLENAPDLNFSSFQVTNLKLTLVKTTVIQLKL